MGTMKIRLNEAQFGKLIKQIVCETLKVSLNEENSYNEFNNTINSEAFQKWFSENGLRDANGDPMLLYHGSGKLFKRFDLRETCDGYHCFTPKKEEALVYTQWNNGDDDWRTIQNAADFLFNEGYEMDNRLPWPKKNDLMNLIDGDGNKIDPEYAYNIVLGFYKIQYKNPTLYYVFLRNAYENDTYKGEYNIDDDRDVWILKRESVPQKTPFPSFPDERLCTVLL